MITVFGKFLRELRHAHTELLRDMADKLGVSPAFLSSVETGKKSIPPAWEHVIAEQYGLPPEQCASLRKAIDQSAKAVTIDLANQSAERKGVAVALARQFDGLSDTQLEQIKKALFSTTSRKKE